MALQPRGSRLVPDACSPPCMILYLTSLPASLIEEWQRVLAGRGGDGSDSSHGGHTLMLEVPGEESWSRQDTLKMFSNLVFDDSTKNRVTFSFLK